MEMIFHVTISDRLHLPKGEGVFIEKEAQAFDPPLKIIRISRSDLNLMTENRPHNGFVLDADPLPVDVIHKLELPLKTEKPPVWLALDQITDPMNVGAILRTCLYFGASGVIICSKNSASLSAVTCKASSGAMESLPIYNCQSMPKFLRLCRELTATSDNHFPKWRILALSIESEAVKCDQLKKGMEEPTIIVVGNEGHGLRTLVREQCIEAVQVGSDKSKSESSTVDSLNVSAAVSVLLYQLLSCPTK